MAWNGTERRKRPHSQSAGTRPPPLDPADLSLAEEGHPARLRASDLEDPKGFRERLVAWLMKQH